MYIFERVQLRSLPGSFFSYKKFVTNPKFEVHQNDSLREHCINFHLRETLAHILVQFMHNEIITLCFVWVCLEFASTYVIACAYQHSYFERIYYSRVLVHMDMYIFNKLQW